jgi:hypothetical protein
MLLYKILSPFVADDTIIPKGLERHHLIGLAGAVFNFALTTTNGSATCMEARRADYIIHQTSPAPRE